MTAYEIRKEQLKEEERIKIELEDATYRNKARVSKGLVETFMKKNNAVALKVLFYIARKHDLNKCLKNIDEKVIEFKFNIDDICNYCNIDRRSLRDNLKYMNETSIEILDTKKRALTFINILPKVIIKDKKIEITMFKEIVEMIENVIDKYVTIDTDNLMRLKHKHTLKMVQLLEMIEGYNGEAQKQRRFTLQEINGFFGTRYKRAIYFENKIIKKTQEELDNYSNLSFDYEKIYDDKKVAGRPKLVGFLVKLKINKKRQTKMFT